MKNQTVSEYQHVNYRFTYNIHFRLNFQFMILNIYITHVRLLFQFQTTDNKNVDSHTADNKRWWQKHVIATNKESLSENKVKQTTSRKCIPVCSTNTHTHMRFDLLAECHFGNDFIHVFAQTFQTVDYFLS